MRTRGLLVLLIVALVIEVAYYERGRPHATRSVTPVARPEPPAQRALTLLDVWTQDVVPNLLLQRSRRQALRAGEVRRAARLERRIRNGLERIHDFPEIAARDPSLRGARSAEVRALRATGSAWARFAAAYLRGTRARQIAKLEADAVRIHQQAYVLVNAALHVAARPDVPAGRHTP